MAKATTKTHSDQCPKCGAREPGAKYCSQCGLRMGHTGKPGRPPVGEKRFRVFTTIPESQYEQLMQLCNEDESQGAFLRAAVERELNVRARRDGK